MFSPMFRRSVKTTTSIASLAYFSTFSKYAYCSTAKASARVVIIGKQNSPGDENLKNLPSSAQIVQYISTVEEVENIDTDANVLFVSEICTPAIMSKALQKCKKVDWIHSRWAGINHLLCPELIENNIPLTNAKGAYSESLGEFCVFGCLYFEKLAPRMLQQKKDKHWEKFTVGMIKGKTIGVIGYGDIGQHCASACKNMGMEVAALRRRPELSSDDPVIDRCYGTTTEGMNQLFAECDYVVCALPLTPLTHHMVGAEQFNHAKPGCVILNVGRGPCIDEAAMVEALKDGRLRGAALDVFEVEPLPKESELWNLDNVFISPHTADVTDSYFQAGVDFFVDNMNRFLEGSEFTNVCDKSAGY